VGTGRKREESVARFESGSVPVLLLSLKAGGVRPNLTQARHDIHQLTPMVPGRLSTRGGAGEEVLGE
jgi:hypothetical protein